MGHISVDCIHDIITLEQSEGGDDKAKTGWTFRRTDYLRLWARWVLQSSVFVQQRISLQCPQTALPFPLNRPV